MRRQRAWRLWAGLVGATLAGCAVDAGGLPGADPADEDARVPTVDAAIDARTTGPDMPTDLFVPPSDGCVAVRETCNRSDDDCDGVIDEGVVLDACDGDGDLCVDGREGCSGGEVTCDDDPGRQVGDACHSDTAPGRLVCGASGLECQSTCVPAAEVCNRRDDDCNGQVDEPGCGIAGTTCTAHVDGGRVYQFCRDSDSWSSARDECSSFGYRLTAIVDEAERAFLASHAGTDSWWVGARTGETSSSERRDPDNWTWRPSGGVVAAGLWTADEPSGDGSCAELLAPGHQLNDLPCPYERYFICEAAVAP